MSVPAASGGRLRRVVALLGVVAVLTVPLAVVFLQVWTGRMADHGVTSSERRGIRYLGPVTQLISVVVEQQSATVRGRRVDTPAVRQAVAAVDTVDRELGARLATTERWTGLRQQVQDVTGRNFADPNDAFVAYTELLDTALELVRKAGDTSELILDPKLDTYYVMNAALLRLPQVLVAAGRYADLVYLIVRGKQTRQPDRLAELATARSRIIEPADDLGVGLEKAFDATSSDTLGPALLRQLDHFRTATDALAPRTAPLTPASAQLDPTAVDNAEDDLRQAARDLDTAALEQLDTLLGHRAAAVVRQLVLAAVALLVGLLVAVGAAIWLGPAGRAAPAPPLTRPPGAKHGDRGDPTSVDASELVASSGLTLTPRRGGARAAR
jgi:hypothetical protein